jgi:undecaprenyl diphosphate synthase
MEPQSAPRHIAIIMDGNGRWATARGLPRVLGHRAGAQAVRRVVEACHEAGVGVLTLYAFSWENRDRPREEIQELMGLLDEFIAREQPTLLANGIRLRAIGRLDELPQEVIGNLRRVVDETAHCGRMTLVLALSYGGRQEIVDAARRLAERVRRGELLPEQIDEAALAGELYTEGLPDPDLLIRTSGEQRLSNFLLWQSSYTEWYVTPTLWPDFTKADLLEAIAEYERRERRFGRLQSGLPC